MTPAALLEHYTRVADGSPIPIILYNMPGSTGINLDAATVIALSRHENILGIKDSSGNVAKIATIVSAVRPDFAAIVGSGGSFYPALCMGAAGTVAALANLAPERCLRLYDLFQQGDHPGARQLQMDLLPINTAVTARWGVAGMKAALDLSGSYYGGAPRAPLQPLSDAQRQELAGLIGSKLCLGAQGRHQFRGSG